MISKIASICAIGLVATTASLTLAQSTDSAPDESAVAQVQPQDDSVALLVEGVGESANRLQDAVDRFGAAMSDAGTQDSGMKALDDMLEAARDVNGSLNEDSEIWAELETLLEQWTEKRDSMNERAKSNPALLPVAARWQEKVDRVVELRTSILDQATDSEILVQDIENKKEVIAAYYELDSIDQVLAEMQVMNDELTAMNEKMRSILEITTGFEEGQTPTTN